MSIPPEMEYVKIWMQQSALFWSRLQSATLIHTGVLAAWYQMGSPHPRLRLGALAAGFAISGFLIAIMVRDGQYMEAMKTKSADCFPSTGKDAPSGRMCGYFIVAIPMLAEATLALNQVCACLK